MKDKGDAIVDIIYDARREKLTMTGYKRTLRALRVLGLDQAGIDRVLGYLEYNHFLKQQGGGTLVEPSSESD